MNVTLDLKQYEYKVYGHHNKNITGVIVDA